ncbi:RusA family crossover junction endodeoxyribonuclease [Salipiger thiooxidans]|uniref:hypothetical protein n=1 Tax=Salipiger thiooxidans TaxID=282683 RepID=UPI001CD65BAC|nr:hypothetical protein [Salipiger thiooxidans]MCA0846095.1 hypothetical protein [Salipiger thiooxidans]
MGTTITLPWPPSALSPNARGHWSIKARHAKKYRSDAAFICMAQGLRKITSDSLSLRITFKPPSRRMFDLDNALASLKSGLDGIADATGVDDSSWTISMAKGEPVKGGAVVIEVTA